MRIGIMFPQDEIALDAGAIRAFAQAAEAIGFDHIAGIDHVLGANTASRPDWTGAYDVTDAFMEPFTLFAFMAGATSRIGFVSTVMVLPQRQAALVAKQAACVDILCNGRLRLGIGTGWNGVEYEALAMDFADRGPMMDDQVAVMRALWTQTAVTFDTGRHRIDDAGIAPLPIQRPIPIWFGGGGGHPQSGMTAHEKVLRRIARTGDGWLPPFGPDAQGQEILETCRGYCADYDRDPATLGLEGFVMTQRGNAFADRVDAWERIGASHVLINCLQDGMIGIDEHVRRMEEVKAELGSRLTSD